MTTHVRLVRADNPGPMTLDGTNSYVVGSPGAGEVVVIDPGPDDEAHLSRLAAAGPVSLILVTHRHLDHTAGSAHLAALTGAPVRAALPELCSPGAEPLHDGENLHVAGVRIDVVATPGHTSDSVCFVVRPDDRHQDPRASDAAGADAAVVLTGDTVLGEGTTVLMERDGGSLSDYLASLDVLERLATEPLARPARPDGPAGGDPLVGPAHGTVTGLPGHGPAVPDLAARVRAYREHRLARLTEVRAALDADHLTPTLDDATVGAVLARVYPDVPAPLRPAATQSVRVQLAHLARAPGPRG